jgi:hypothetical protein
MTYLQQSDAVKIENHKIIKERIKAWQREKKENRYGLAHIADKTIKKLMEYINTNDISTK